VIDWVKENDELYKLLAPKIENLIVEQAGIVLGNLPGGADIAVIHAEAIEWMRSYGFELVKGINEKTANLVRSVVSDYVSTPGMTRGDLVEMLTGTFGPTRAEMIAVTETTRALAEGEKIVGDNLRKLGINMVDVWNTNNDDLVCPICGPRNRKKRGDGWVDNPPAHPRCRCWITHRIEKK
jgi:hypothetical protein